MLIAVRLMHFSVIFSFDVPASLDLGHHGGLAREEAIVSDTVTDEVGHVEAVWQVVVLQHHAVAAALLRVALVVELAGERIAGLVGNAVLTKVLEHVHALAAAAGVLAVARRAGAVEDVLERDARTFANSIRVRESQRKSRFEFRSKIKIYNVKLLFS